MSECLLNTYYMPDTVAWTGNSVLNITGSLKIYSPVGKKKRMHR